MVAAWRAGQRPTVNPSWPHGVGAIERWTSSVGCIPRLRDYSRLGPCRGHINGELSAEAQNYRPSIDHSAPLRAGERALNSKGRQRGRQAGAETMPLPANLEGSGQK